MVVHENPPDLINTVYEMGKLLFHFGKVITLDDINDYGKWHHDGKYGMFDMIHHWWLGEIISEIGATIGETAVYALALSEPNEPATQTSIKTAEEILKDYIQFRNNPKQ